MVRFRAHAPFSEGFATRTLRLPRASNAITLAKLALDRVEFKRYSIVHVFLCIATGLKHWEPTVEIPLHLRPQRFCMAASPSTGIASGVWHVPLCKALLLFTYYLTQP